MTASIYSIVTYNILTTIEECRDLNELTSMTKEVSIVQILRRGNMWNVGVGVGSGNKYTNKTHMM